MSTAAWGGSASRKARSEILPRLPLPCAKCGLDVTRDMRWHVGHQVDRALGGVDDPSNYWPEHGRCNESAGGKLGHALNDRTPNRAPTRRRPVPVEAFARREWS